MTDLGIITSGTIVVLAVVALITFAVLAHRIDDSWRTR